MTETLTIPNWQALLSDAQEHDRQAWALRKLADEEHCPFQLNTHEFARCMFDTGHEGEHRLPQWSWTTPPE